MLSKYLNFLNEQVYGFDPVKPVQKPQGSRPTSVKRIQPKVPQAPKSPVNPQLKKQNSTPKRTTDQVKNQEPKRDIKSYFNYMVWTTKILKQGETFRKNCYTSNCSQYEVGTGDRRVCKDRCDIETCKKVIQLLQASMSKCSESDNPNRCKARYNQLIPLYQEKLNKISSKFIKKEKTRKAVNTKVG